jgi:hypothetical protein
MILVHGTGDQVMPYSGQNFLNPKALAHADDYWTSIDPTASAEPPSSRTYTADIARYVETLSSRVFHCARLDERPFGSATTLAVGRKCDAPFHVLTVSGGNHVWPGHAKSGPDSGQYPNMDFDATAEIARFFSIPMSVIPFSAFTAEPTVSSFQPKFTLHSSFTVGSTSSGFNPASEAVTLKIGTFAVTIPPGSFTLTAPGTYSFFGVISGLSINAMIADTGGQSYTFDATANANLSRTKSPAPVTLTIGNHTGTTTAQF